MTNVTVIAGTTEAKVTLPAGATAADFASNDLVAAMFNTADKIVIIRDGIELPADAPLSDGDQVELVNQAGDKG